MEFLRTDDSCFENLQGYDFVPHYVNVSDGEGGELRLHYLDEGPRDADPILLMHGEPSWSYLYRKMIPVLVAVGHRVIAPDLIGFGRSDKPAKRSDYTYQRHVDWMQAFLEQLDLNRTTLVCQDWGGADWSSFSRGKHPSFFSSCCREHHAADRRSRSWRGIQKLAKVFAGSP